LPCYDPLEIVSIIIIIIIIAIEHAVVVLVAIALNEVDDVRPVLEFYSQFDDPIAAFREKQRQLQVWSSFALRHSCSFTA